MCCVKVLLLRFLFTENLTMSYITSLNASLKYAGVTVTHSVGRINQILEIWKYTLQVHWNERTKIL